MRGNSVLGIIFADVDEQQIRCLSEHRTLGSIPFGGRYRLIDFALSNMVNSGIDKVGVVTKGNYKSILNHLGSGKNWDLSKKNGGLYILPPFGSDYNFNNKIKILSNLKDFISNSREEYVLLCDCNVICNIDYGSIFNRHILNHADITLVYSEGTVSKKDGLSLIVDVDDDEKVKKVSLCSDFVGKCNYGLNMFIIKKDLLNNIVSECVRSYNLDFERCVIQKNIDKLNVYGYKFTGFFKTITSVNNYFDANMLLLKPNIKNELFNSERPIYTKVKDDMPTVYSKGSKVNECLVADGCEINGEISNSIIFRGVKVGKGAKIANCILMQNTVIEDNCILNYVISDKGVVIKNSRRLMGYHSYPIYVEKARII